jgi:lipoprotein-releasing system ATP-binding protein
MSQPIIEVKNVFKSYGDLPVLKGVSMSVNKGEVISIVGASGAGKSTLMHIIGTLDQADKGQVIIDDKDLSGLRGKALSDFRNIIESKNRNKAGFSVPAHGLYLTKVKYPYL